MTTRVPPELLQPLWDSPASVDLTNSGADDLTVVTLLAEATLAAFPARTEIEVDILALSESGTDDIIVQVGDSGGFHTTGYTSGAKSSATGGEDDVTSTAGFILGDTWAAASAYNINIQLLHLGSNLWRCKAVGLLSDGTVDHLAYGTVTLDTVLTQLRITSAAGSVTFDGGTAYIRHR